MLSEHKGNNKGKQMPTQPSRVWIGAGIRNSPEHVARGNRAKVSDADERGSTVLCTDRDILNRWLQVSASRQNDNGAKRYAKQSWRQYLLKDGGHRRPNRRLLLHVS